MGLGIGFSKDSYDRTTGCAPPGNPNPDNYEILEHEKIGDCLIVKVRYPDCRNYEGVKILVYLGVALKQLKAQKRIDPHFGDNEKYISPVARFVPTEAGMALARNFARFLANDK